tara:strand:- start:11387 stop:12544 length:1158 start_codon:yes stop_codon:yes gene_type:complete
MSFNKLRELTNRFEQKWINGGFIFGYENEINENHNNDYPLLLVLPPTSVLPTTEGDVQEEYSYECLIVKPYYQNQTGSLDSVFTLLEQEALSWLQRVLDSYTNKEVILSPDSISVEREKELYNDKLIQVRLSFTLNSFSHSFTFTDEPRITNLSPLVWLRSDMGVKTSFSGGNEVVSKWIDQSGNGNHFEQATAIKMPQYKYEITENDYPYLLFDGSNDFMSCVNGGINSGSGIPKNHTIAWVAKGDSQQGRFLAKNDNTSIQRFNIDVDSSNFWQVTHSDDDTDDTSVSSSSHSSNTLSIFVATFNNTTSKIYKETTMIDNESAPSFDSFSDYGTSTKLTLGSSVSGSSTFFKGSIQELIIFGSSLEDAKIKTLTDYLKHKYNI